MPAKSDVNDKPFAVRSRYRRQPTEKEIELLEMVGGGTTVREAAAQLDRNYYSLIGRVNRLKEISGRPTLPSLVHWGLTEMHIHYDRHNLRKIDSRKLEVVQRIAIGQSRAQICGFMYLTKDGFERRVRNARADVGATNMSHLVAICWSEDWIV